MSVAVRHQAYCAEKASHSCCASRFKSFHPLPLTFCTKVKQVWLTLSLMLGFTVKWILIAFYLYMLGPTLHLVPASTISFNTSWGSVPQCKLIYHALHLMSKKEGQYIQCKLTQAGFPRNTFQHAPSKYFKRF